MPTLEESMSFYKYPHLISDLLQRAIRSGQPETGMMELISAKQNLKWVKIWIQADHIEGKCTRIYGALSDITQDVKLNNLLEEKEKRFSNAFDHAPIGMALVSLKGEWIKVNQKLCNLMGYTESEFLNCTLQDLTYPEDLENDLKQLHELIDGKINSYSMEKRYLHKGGQVIWALLNVSMVRNENDDPLYFVSQMKDITERKRDTEIIRAQNYRLFNFAHIVSHNLRSHAGNIQMLTDLISSENNFEEREKLISMLSLNAANLLETLNNLNEVVKVHDNVQVVKATLFLSNEIRRILEIVSATKPRSH